MSEALEKAHAACSHCHGRREDQCPDHAGHPCPEALHAAIEAAIAEARREGYNEAAVTFSTGSTKAIARARHEGAREMRERAALIVEDTETGRMFYARGCAATIRALPLLGEEAK